MLFAQEELNWFHVIASGGVGGALVGLGWAGYKWLPLFFNYLTQSQAQRDKTAADRAAHDDGRTDAAHEAEVCRLLVTIADLNAVIADLRLRGEDRLLVATARGIDLESLSRQVKERQKFIVDSGLKFPDPLFPDPRNLISDSEVERRTKVLAQRSQLLQEANSSKTQAPQKGS